MIYRQFAFVSGEIVSKSVAKSDPLGAVGGEAASEDKLSDSDDCGDLQEIRRRRMQRFAKTGDSDS